ncbi:T cell receptor delta constant [Rhinolophus ferrumequinum]|nr:T cell receptor delta constant [Rhinolophus ferrumequinum]
MCSWDTRQMTFGAGTKLFVEPQNQPPVKPHVFIMKNGTNVACLVKDFYPKNVNISLQSSKKIIEFDPVVAVTPSGKYSAVKLGRYADSNSVTCSVQHNDEIVYSTDTEPKTNASDNPKPVETENIHQTSERCSELKVHAEKVNMIYFSSKAD